MSVAGHHLPIWFDEATGPADGEVAVWNAAAGRFESAPVVGGAIPDGTYVPADPVIAVVYNEDGTVDSVTEDGIETTFTYNADGTVATSTRLGVTRTYTYVGDNLTAVA